MATLPMLTDASSAMTVISLITFIGILWWTFGLKRSADFDTAAQLPFADDDYDRPPPGSTALDTEKHHG